jgi:hypothetical protein
MKKVLLLFILIIGIALIYAYVQTRPHAVQTVTPTNVSDETSSDSSSTAPAAISQNDYVPPVPAASDPQGFDRYENVDYKFSLLYPNDLSVREYKESADSMSATFESPDGAKGFQIYVTKYVGTQITPERFKLDEPSGVRTDPTDVIIDGTRATMFWGNNALMGDTREVWFIHDGFLYEVTTYKDLDSWLGSIMQSWKFLP